MMKRNERSKCEREEEAASQLDPFYHLADKDPRWPQFAGKRNSWKTILQGKSAESRRNGRSCAADARRVDDEGLNEDPSNR